MNNTGKIEAHSFDLIRGTFDADAAREILMTFLVNKIQFHERRNWGISERLGKTDPASAQRLNELKQTKEALTQLLRKAQAEGLKLQIQSTITLVPVKE